MSATTVRRSIDAATRPRARRTLLLDPWLIVAALGLVACSLITISGATRDDIPGNPDYYVTRQAIVAAVGLALATVIARFDYSRLRDLRYGIYGFLLVSNLVVYALASATRGSRRWIELPFFQYQPSEIGKVLLVVSLAAFVVDRARRLDEVRTTFRIAGLALLPALLVIGQPDLGTGMVYLAILVTMLLIAGTPWRHLAALAGLGVIAVSILLVLAPALGVEVLKPYQVQRLTGFVNPSNDPRNQTYQINQSLIAIGSGQKTGRGVAGATQTGLNFLPEHHTDFVFAVVGEQYGFVGAAVVLSLYAMLIWRALRILTLAKNLYGTLIAGGIFAMLSFQVFVNVGMTIGIMPITGVPLPLMSYGGSSVLVTFICLGLLQSIHVQGRIATRGKGRVHHLQ